MSTVTVTGLTIQPGVLALLDGMSKHLKKDIYVSDQKWKTVQVKQADFLEEGLAINVFHKTGNILPYTTTPNDASPEITQTQIFKMNRMSIEYPTLIGKNFDFQIISGNWFFQNNILESTSDEAVKLLSYLFNIYFPGSSTLDDSYSFDELSKILNSKIITIKAGMEEKKQRYRNDIYSHEQAISAIIAKVFELEHTSFEPIPLNDVKSEFESLRNHPLIESIKSVSGYFSKLQDIIIITKPVLLKTSEGCYMPMGRYRIVVNPGRYDEPLIFNETFADKYAGPHGRPGGNVCWGGFGSTPNSLIMSGKLYAFMDIFAAWASDYNVGSQTIQLDALMKDRGIIVDKTRWLANSNTIG